MIPHITNEIKERVVGLGAKSKADVVIAEIGGTVGDIESLPFLEAIRQMRKDAGRENVLYVHVTLLPYIGGSGEVKTKPTQHSVKELRSIGITPDVIICRSDTPIEQEIKDKIALFCDVEPEAVIGLLTMKSIYEVPVVLEDEGLGSYIVSKLQLAAREPDLRDWRALVQRIHRPKRTIEIALAGKYTELHDAYLSVAESLRHAALFNDVDVDIRWVNTEEIERQGAEKLLQGVQGIVVPGGFGDRGVRGKIEASRYARVNDIPCLGLCYGMHMEVIEFARNVCGLEGANSTEIDSRTPHPVIDVMPDQRDIADLGGTMRLGLYPCQLVPGTKAAAAYGEGVVYERHRHRFEFNNHYRERLEQAGLIVSGVSPDGRLVEIVELRAHPWFVASQFHPEFKSRPNRPHPLFRDFIKAALSTAPKVDQRPRELVPVVA